MLFWLACQRIARISGAALPYKLAFVGTYGGEFDDDIGQVVRKFPGVWVTYGGGPIKPHGTSKQTWMIEATFAVMVGARNVRGEESTRHGSTTAAGRLLEVGTYRLRDDVSQLLLHQDFGLPIEALQPVGIKTLYNTSLNGDALSVLALEYRTCWLERLETVGDAQYLRVVGLQYSLPGADQAFASDVITLKEKR